MRVALVTNALEQRTRGNHTTVARWMAHARAGVEIHGVDADPDQDLDPVPDVVHGYHALHGGVAARALARRYGRPLVVSLGGTDLYACLKGDAQVAGVLQAADCVTGAFASFRRMLLESLGTDVAYVTVPRGIDVPDGVPPHAWDGRQHALLPAGLRPAKDPLLAIDLADELVRRGLPFTLRILGPDMNLDTARRVREHVAGRGHVSLGESEPEEMADAYAAADVVWNTSIFEGGANALLEAAAHGCAVFARDIPGNRDLLGDSGVLGTLFDAGDRDAVEAYHRALGDETESARRARIERARAYLREHHDPRAEARALESVWRRVIDG